MGLAGRHSRDEEDAVVAYVTDAVGTAVGAPLRVLPVTMGISEGLRPPIGTSTRVSNKEGEH